MGGIHGVRAAGVSEASSGCDGAASTGGEAREGLPLRQQRFIASGEPLLCCLLAHTHGGADLAPGSARTSGLIDEMADEGIALVAQLLSRHDRVGEVVERVTIGS